MKEIERKRENRLLGIVIECVRDWNLPPTVLAQLDLSTRTYTNCWLIFSLILSNVHSNGRDF